MTSDSSKAFDLKITVGESSFAAAGDAERVMEALAEFKSMLELAKLPRRQPQKEKEGNGTGGGGDGGPHDTTQPLAVFVKRAWPDQASKFTGIVMWARDHDNKLSLTPSEIEAYWRKTPGKAPANPSQACKSAESKGWLHSEGSGKWSLTGHGEEMVKATPMSS